MNDVEGHTIPAPHERVRDHVRGAGLWTQHGGVDGLLIFEACLDKKRSASGAVVILAKGGSVGSRGYRQ